MWRNNWPGHRWRKSRPQEGAVLVIVTSGCQKTEDERFQDGLIKKAIVSKYTFKTSDCTLSYSCIANICLTCNHLKYLAYVDVFNCTDDRHKYAKIPKSEIDMFSSCSEQQIP
jgi:hypothetical protein